MTLENIFLEAMTLIFRCILSGLVCVGALTLFYALRIPDVAFTWIVSLQIGVFFAFLMTHLKKL